MPSRKAVNLSLDAALVAEARVAKINLSAVTEKALRAEIASLQMERWRRENAGALEAMQQRIDSEGVAGEGHRRFG